ncbi:MAG: QueT transporter family protein [Clostridiales bacterium]|nr:QueT transporter family protein [Clostridiales bacterium]
MKNSKTIKITMSAVIAAMYAALFYAQNFIAPGTASQAVQFRVCEMLNVLALFTPYAIPGLTIGCIVSNLSGIAMGLPLDMIFGSLATLGATWCIYLLRNVKIKGYPLFAMLMPAIWNGIIIGWEIEVFFNEGPFIFSRFLIGGGYVALGELGVMLVLGTILYYALKKAKIEKQINRQ